MILSKAAFTAAFDFAARFLPRIAGETMNFSLSERKVPKEADKRSA